MMICRSIFALATVTLVGAQTSKPGTFSDYQTETAGAMHKISVADLPQPYATKSVDNGPDLVPRPKDAWPQAPPGFKVELYADGFDNPREIRTAPNGDLFVAESDPGVIKVLRGITADGKAARN
ncbi:MAG TPA: sorbosone dehydrogenase family protein, partial [Terriglobales bacterium]|nr:sorbosone dehydrogenase family protein [Terriglobales bacterium]